MTDNPKSTEESDLLTIAYMDGYYRGKDAAAGRVHAIIRHWRTEASRLDREAVELARNCRDADAARRMAEARIKRTLAGELERVLEGEK